MKNLLTITALASAMAFTSCSKEASLEEQENANLTTTSQVNLNAKEQTPNEIFDTQRRGIYKGVIAAGHSQDRGVIWINVENNGEYSAYAEMEGGEIIDYTSQGDYSQETTDQSFNFIANNSSFILDLSQVKARVTNASINNELYFIEITKETSTRRSSVLTGTFSDPENPFFSGTWNLTTTGETTGGAFGEEYFDQLIVTYNGYMFTDNNFENFDVCTLVDYLPGADVDSVLAGGQTSDLSGPITWHLVRDAALIGDYTNEGCTGATSGTFSWSDANEAYDGVILLD
ncbi:hypothetical protein ULMS_20400 [Patiriisocius marinistellae]|uniref:Uncharacterized protein n=1 Tax=Patiriisocius marinistellae TaxID=2494560 RepID=A0A5J4FZ64_9FLAO|nr:hypothetical protein [Patiriisocius marinistellae]GEQ86532.1 hypothetical protein ULMS_20400 [Patiriisocius marinistellae]